jgi:hypothetical protein
MMNFENSFEGIKVMARGKGSYLNQFKCENNQGLDFTSVNENVNED